MRHHNPNVAPFIPPETLEDYRLRREKAKGKLHIPTPKVTPKQRKQWHGMPPSKVAFAKRTETAPF